MKPLFLTAAVLLFCTTGLGCASSETEEETEAPGTNALREYVNTPKDKARAAGRAIGRQQRQTTEQAGELADE